MIQDQSESNSKRRKDRNFYLSEAAGLLKTVIGWLSKKEIKALLRVGSIISLHFEIKGFLFYRTLSLSLSHTHTHYIQYVYIFFIFLFTMLSYLTYFIGNEQ